MLTLLSLILEYKIECATYTSFADYAVRLQDLPYDVIINSCLFNPDHKGGCIYCNGNFSFNISHTICKFAQGDLKCILNCGMYSTTSNNISLTSYASCIGLNHSVYMQFGNWNLESINMSHCVASGWLMHTFYDCQICQAKFIVQISNICGSILFYEHNSALNMIKSNLINNTDVGTYQYPACVYGDLGLFNVTDLNLVDNKVKWLFFMNGRGEHMYVTNVYYASTTYSNISQWDVIILSTNSAFINEISPIKISQCILEINCPTIENKPYVYGAVFNTINAILVSIII